MSFLNDAAASEIRAEMARQHRCVGKLAKALGVTHKTVANRLSGRVPLSLDDLYAISRWLDVPPLHFIVNEPEKVFTNRGGACDSSATVEGVGR
jgi:transcriptional regulator with XRE-family HTH domain